MSGRNTVLRMAGKFGMLVGAVFVVTVLLAAIPAHNPPSQQATTNAQESSAPLPPDSDNNSMPGMDMSDEKANEKMPSMR